ncbi:MAG: radical SAM protein, partial [Deltaproteobacteria bacterium]|nr:radical SAM protein [Deltaproteobacteria bacterium]
MNRPYVAKESFSRFGLWGDMLQKGRALAFDLEWTARCNNNCRHCYINLPASDAKAKAQELSLAEVQGIVDEAVKMGALWCLITGGEPLLRPDFPDLYLFLKKKGLLITLFTNATLVTEEHIRLFLKYPPKEIEVTVYGLTEKTYERVTRRPGSFRAFRRGLNLLLNRGLNVRLKAMALRSNLHELSQIAGFCEGKTGAPFRFDPFLYRRLDGDPRRNREIRDERLSPAEIATLEHQDPKRFPELQKWCAEMYAPEEPSSGCHHLFHCGAGIG